MNQYYPDKHHPIFFIQNALQNEGVLVEFNSRDERTKGMWGLLIDGKPFVWLIDNRWLHEREHEDPSAKEMIAQGALVCCAQKPDAERIGAKWLPLAATPDYMPPKDPVKKLTDTAFVGYVRDKGREQALLNISSKYSLSIAQGQFGVTAVTAYHQARLGVNIPTRYGDPLAYDSANMRCYEILATGTPLVTAHEDYLADLGIEYGVTGFTYRNAQDLLDVIDDALKNHDLEAIGNNAVQLVKERHTYRHRAKQVMTWLSA